jgi:hypothetical protein
MYIDTCERQGLFVCAGFHLQRYDFGQPTFVVHVLHIHVGLGGLREVRPIPLEAMEDLLMDYAPLEHCGGDRCDAREGRRAGEVVGSASRTPAVDSYACRAAG